MLRSLYSKPGYIIRTWRHAVRSYTSSKAEQTLDYIRRVKREHPDAAVLTQVGGFFELIDEDARLHGRRIGVDVRYRAISGPNSEKYTLVSSFPVVAVDKYLSRLIKGSGDSVHKRHKVVILAQSKMDDVREEKKRPIYQIITPGTVTDHAGSPGELYRQVVGQSTIDYCMSVYEDKSSRKTALAWTDLSTGFLSYGLYDPLEVENKVRQIGPQEILIEQGDFVQEKGYTKLSSLGWLRDFELQGIKFPAADIVSFLHMFRVPEQALYALKGSSFAEKKAICAVMKYCSDNISGGSASITFKCPMRAPSDTMYLAMDTETITTLSIFSEPTDEIPSLWKFLDCANTAQGQRLAKDWLKRPLGQKELIEQRLDIVERLSNHRESLAELRNSFDANIDGERALQGVLSYKPDQWRLRALCQATYETAQHVDKISDLQFSSLASLTDRLSEAMNRIGRVSEEILDTLDVTKQADTRVNYVFEETDELIDQENQAMVYDRDENESLLTLPEYVYNEDEFVDEEYDYVSEFSSIALSEDNQDPTKRNPFLPVRRRIEDPSRFPQRFQVRDQTNRFYARFQEIENMQRSFLLAYQEFEQTIRGLFLIPEALNKKSIETRLVWHPRYLYCVRIASSGGEISSHLKSRASVLNQNKTVAYISNPAWAELGIRRDEIINLMDAMEQEILIHYSECVKDLADDYTACLDTLAELDVLSSFAHVAEKFNLVKPTLSDNSQDLIAIGARHPIVEFQLLQQYPQIKYVANDCELSCTSKGGSNASVITGPNMSGKSTYLRQMGIMVIMAQIGCFVAAEKATLGVCDAVFCRFGTHDDLYRGRSAFMTEMLETSTILNKASKSSLALIDEVGRGTDVQEGEAIAYATIKYLSEERGCRTLFATHFGQELYADLAKLPQVQFRKTIVRPDGKGVIHKLEPGVSGDSFGIEIARMAGFPSEFLQ